MEVFNVLEGVSHSVSLPINLQACHAIDSNKWVLSEVDSNRCVCVCVFERERERESLLMYSVFIVDG